MNMPMDFNASVVHMNQSALMVDPMVERPRIARRAASAAARGALIPAARTERSGLSSAATGKVDIQIHFARFT
jgi:hypothetical protein